MYWEDSLGSPSSDYWEPSLVEVGAEVVVVMADSSHELQASPLVVGMTNSTVTMAGRPVLYWVGLDLVVHQKWVETQSVWGREWLVD